MPYRRQRMKPMNNPNETPPSLWGIRLIHSTTTRQNWGAWVRHRRVHSFESFTEARLWVLLELEAQLRTALAALDALEGGD